VSSTGPTASAPTESARSKRKIDFFGRTKEKPSPQKREGLILLGCDFGLFLVIGKEAAGLAIP
jgi:hypothetical protein